MKYGITFGLLILMGACSGGDEGGACADTDLVGTWNNDDEQGENIVFKSSCQFTSNLCEITGTYPPVLGDSGTVAVTVTSSSNDTGCLPVGETECTFGIVSTSLAFDCGGGTRTYSRQ